MNYRPPNQANTWAYAFARNLSFLQPVRIEHVRNKLKPNGIILAYNHTRRPSQRGIDEVREITRDSIGTTVLGFACESKTLQNTEYIYLRKTYTHMNHINASRFINVHRPV